MFPLSNYSTERPKCQDKTRDTNLRKTLDKTPLLCYNSSVVGLVEGGFDAVLTGPVLGDSEIQFHLFLWKENQTRRRDLLLSWSKESRL